MDFFHFHLDFDSEGQACGVDVKSQLPFNHCLNNFSAVAIHLIYKSEEVSANCGQCLVGFDAKAEYMRVTGQRISRCYKKNMQIG